MIIILILTSEENEAVNVSFCLVAFLNPFTVLLSIMWQVSEEKEKERESIIFTPPYKAQETHEVDGY